MEVEPSFERAAAVVGMPVTGERDQEDAVRLPAPFALRLAARLESDEDLRVALAPADYTRWRDVLARALAAAGVPVEGA